MRSIKLVLCFLLFYFSSCKKDPVNELTHLSTNWLTFENSKPGKPAQNITSITSDTKGNVWASYVWDSIYPVDSTLVPGPSGYYWQHYDTVIYQSYLVKFKGITTSEILDTSGISNLYKPVSSLGFNRNNDMFIGTTIGFGLIKYSNKQESLLYPQGGTSYSFEKFLFDKSDNLWFGAGNGGLYKLTAQELQSFNRTNSAITYPEVVKYYCLDSEGDLWFNNETGLFRYSKGSIAIIPFSYAIQIYSSIVDRSDTVFLLGFNPETQKDELMRVRYDFSGNYASLDNFDIPFQPLFMNHIAVDSKNRIWISTSFEGLMMYDHSKWTAFNTGNSSIHSDQLTCMYIDRYDNIWYSCSDGTLSLFNDAGISYSN